MAYGFDNSRRVKEDRLVGTIVDQAGNLGDSVVVVGESGSRKRARIVKRVAEALKLPVYGSSEINRLVLSRKIGHDARGVVVVEGVEVDPGSLCRGEHSAAVIGTDILEVGEAYVNALTGGEVSFFYEV